MWRLATINNALEAEFKQEYFKNPNFSFKEDRFFFFLCNETSVEFIFFKSVLYDFWVKDPTLFLQQITFKLASLFPMIVSNWVEYKFLKKSDFLLSFPSSRYFIFTWARLKYLTNFKFGNYFAWEFINNYRFSVSFQLNLWQIIYHVSQLEFLPNFRMTIWGCLPSSLKFKIYCVFVQQFWMWENRKVDFTTQIE